MSELEQIKSLARQLNMLSIVESVEDIIDDVATNTMNCSQAILSLLTNEVNNRSLQAQRKRIRAAAFPELKYLQDLSMDDLPAEARSALPKLQTLEFISQGRNVILYGNPGTGKTHIATALGILACQKGYSVLFTSVPRLLTNIREARSEQKLSRLQNKFEKYDVVICDEFGYVSCDKEGAELLFNHLSLRSGARSTIITTNLAFSRWNEIIQDKVLVNALVDRLTHKAFIINMTGNSYRLKETQQLMTKKL
jgi:DNA replication protein DnaC